MMEKSLALKILEFLWKYLEFIRKSMTFTIDRKNITKMN
jgi:hypothetical protein